MVFLFQSSNFLNELKTGFNLPPYLRLGENNRVEILKEIGSKNDIVLPWPLKSKFRGFSKDFLDVLFWVIDVSVKGNWSSEQTNQAADRVIYYQNGQPIEEAKKYEDSSDKVKQDIVKKTLKEKNSGYEGTLDDFHKDVLEVQKEYAQQYAAKTPKGENKIEQTVFKDSAILSQEDLLNQLKIKRLKDDIPKK